ncbi:hypothetical protein MRB53_037887 [Persea americana]|nr:hypothetical protein MRB53_037887 [Persea americana]
MALRRKKLHETAMEATTNQMMTLESQIGSIETANINKETLDALDKAAKAMGKINNGRTIDTVDDIMCVSHFLRRRCPFAPYHSVANQTLKSSIC